jgi:hypothetical protein
MVLHSTKPVATLQACNLHMLRLQFQHGRAFQLKSDMAKAYRLDGIHLAIALHFSGVSCVAGTDCYTSAVGTDCWVVQVSYRDSWVVQVRPQRQMHEMVLYSANSVRDIASTAFCSRHRCCSVPHRRSKSRHPRDVHPTFFICTPHFLRLTKQHPADLLFAALNAGAAVQHGRSRSWRPTCPIPEAV